MDDIKYLKDIESFHLYYVESIGSTNTFLKENFSKYPNNSILLAKVQTNGRGRYTRIWKSDEDYTFSILFKDLHHNEIIAPMSIVRALKEYGFDTKIKWPNDIYLNNKKLSGILIESVYGGISHLATIVGIGINKTDKEEVLGIGLNKNIDSIDLISKIIHEYNILIKDDFKNYINEYISYSNVINKKIIYQNEEYIVKGINEFGHLIIENDNISKTISSDEINIKY